MRTGTSSLRSLSAPPSSGQIDHETGREDIGAELTQQLDRAFRGAAGGDEIVHQNHTLALLHRVFMHFHLVDAVFQRIARWSRAYEGSLPFLRIGMKPAET